MVVVLFYSTDSWSNTALLRNTKYDYICEILSGKSFILNEFVFRIKIEYNVYMKFNEQLRVSC
jgi:hypothetical protein